MPDSTNLRRDLDALRIHRPAASAPAAGELASEKAEREAPPDRSRGFAAPAAARRARPRRRGLVWLLVLALLALAAYALNDQYGEILSAPEVTVARVVGREATTRTVVLTMAGYVVADRKATVGPQIPGRLMSLSADEGDTVEEGFVLARLNDAWYVAQSASIESRLENARLQMDRAKKLLDKGAGDLDDYDTARFEVSALEGQAKQAREELDFTVIRAPISGRVIRRDADIGELVTPGGGPGQIKTAIISLVDPATFEVEVDVNETDIAKVEIGRAADIVLDAFPAKKYPGVVRKIAPVANRQKGTIQIKVRFDRADDDVRPEMSARVALLEKGAAGEAPREGGGRKLLIPTEALVGTAEEKSVFVVGADRRAVLRRVEVSGLADGLAEVRSGLAEGEEVVVSGHGEFGDGDRVRIAGR